jgi:hypothetical protein
MFGFPGAAGGARVSLAGRSRAAAETCEEALARARADRERRARARLEARAATEVQAAWRGRAARRAAAAEARARWAARYGAGGERAGAADAAALDSPFLRELLFFADAAREADTLLLARGAELALARAAPGAPPALCALAAGSAEAAALATLRARRLVALAVDALAAHARALLAGGGAPAAAAPAARVLVAAAVALSSPRAWAAALGGEAAGRAAAARALGGAGGGAGGGGLFGRLAGVAAAACPEGGPAGAPAEALVAGGAANCLAVRDLLPPPRQPRGGTGAGGGSGLAASPAALFAVPLFARRLPSLAAALPALWRAAAADAAALPPAALAAALPGGAPAAYALLGNLLEGARPALAALGAAGAAAARAAAVDFLSAAGGLLAALPRGALARGDGGWVEEEDEEQAAAEEEERGAPGAFAAAPPPPPGVAAQLQLASDAGVLAAATRAALPAATAAEAAAVGAGDAPADAAAAAAVCAYAGRVLRLPGHRQRALLALALPAGLAARLWFGHLRAAAAGDASSSSSAAAPEVAPEVLALWAEAFTAGLLVLGDEGLYGPRGALPLGEVFDATRPRAGALALLKRALWQALWVEAAPGASWTPAAGAGAARVSPAAAAAAAAPRRRLVRAAGRLAAQLHARNGRRPFAPPAAFYADGLPAERFLAEVSTGAAAGADADDPGASRAWGILAHAPFLVPFRERARVFQRLVAAERAAHRRADAYGFAGAAAARVQRGRVLADALAALGGAPPEALRGRVRIEFVDAHGTPEAGVDGGGLFKEFLEEVLREGFAPPAGLFRATADGRLYPAPGAASTREGAARLELLGRMVGKALWEGVLVELPLAGFFLKRLRGAPADVDDLASLDPQLAQNLTLLKHYPGDVAELGLTFTLAEELPGGGAREVELAPGGRSTAVTAANAAAYVARVADYRLNVAPRAAAAAFAAGVHALVPRPWLAPFNEAELQELIGGAEGAAGLDLADLAAHARYAGGYSADHPAVRALWTALATLSPPQQADFLRFVTACPRPPLLGFAHLEPPLTVQLAGGAGGGAAAEGRLPTAATCANLLKLPPYADAETVRAKLLWAIEARPGFDLS